MSRTINFAACLLLLPLGSSSAQAAVPQVPARPAPAAPAQAAPTQAAPAHATPASRASATGEGAGTSGAYYEFLKGRNLEGLGRVSEALEAYERAAKMDPRSSQVRAEIAALYARQNRPAEAVQAAKAALALDPEDSEAHWVLGTVYSALIEAKAEEEASGTTRARRGRRANGSAGNGAAGGATGGNAGTGGSGAATGGTGAAAPEEPTPSLDDAIVHLEKARPERRYDNGLHLALGRLYLAKEDYAKAIEVTSYVFEREPGAIDAAYLLAQSYDGADQRGRAIDTLEEALGGEPEYPRAFAYLADLYVREHRWDRAADAYARAAAASPDPLEYQLRQSAALVSAGQTAAAKDLLATIAKSNPKEPRALYLLAEAQRGVQDLDGAEATARKLIELSPKQPFGPHALAQVYAQRHQYKDVIAVLAPYLQSADAQTLSSRGFAPIWVSLGTAYQETGDFTKAIDAFQHAKQVGGSDGSFDAYLVQAYLSSGDKTKAVQLAAEMSARRPGNLRLMNLEAEARLQNGETGAAIGILEDAVTKNPDDAQAYVALANLYLEAKQYPKAEDVLTRAGGKFPQDITIPFQLGAVFEEQRKAPEAEQAFRRALALDPQHAPTLNYLGYMYADHGQRLDEAVKLLSQAVEIDPYNASYLDSLGWAYYKQGSFDKARDFLTRASDQMPRNSVVQEHVGDVLFALHDNTGAVAAWQRALAGDGRSIDKAAIERKIEQARKR
jgi:tetratricopeptide (TPR) repeat protein